MVPSWGGLGKEALLAFAVCLQGARGPFLQVSLRYLQLLSDGEIEYKEGQDMLPRGDNVL